MVEATLPVVNIAPLKLQKALFPDAKGATAELVIGGANGPVMRDIDCNISDTANPNIILL